MGSRSLHPAVAPLFVLASAAASSCILFVDEVGGGEGGSGGASSSLSAGGDGSVGGSGQGGELGSGGQAGGVCTATVAVSGTALVVPGLDGDSELVLNVVGDPVSSSAAFARVGQTIRRFSVAPGNPGPVQPWFEAVGAYPGARLAPAPDNAVLVTYDGSIFELVGENNELAQADDLQLPGGIPAPPSEAVQVGGFVFLRAGGDVYQIGVAAALTTGGLVDRLTANDQAAHWIYNQNAVVSCTDASCSGQEQSPFANPAPPFPVFTVSAGPSPTIFLRTSSSVDPAFVGSVGAPLRSVDEPEPLATARSAAFAGEHLVVVTASGAVHACCVDGVPSCGPPAVGPEDVLRVAASPDGNRAVLAIEEAGQTKLQLITVTP